MKLARRPSAVIFDLDGVLLDTEPLYTQATQEIVGEYGAVFDWSVKAGMIGRSDDEGARHLITSLGIPLAPEEYLRRRKPILDGLFAGALEIAGARELVHALSARGVPLGVATSSATYQYRRKTGERHWFRAFRAVVCGDDPRVERPKPAPDIFLVTAAALDTEPSECVVFEDSLAGVAAARAAGMQVVALPDPAMDASQFAHADLVIRSFAELAPEDLGF